MRKGILAVFGLLWGIACSSQKSDSTCQELQTKLSQCGLVAAVSCDAISPCDVRCSTNATCDELKAMPPSGPFLDCQAACAGIGPDPFVCANGTQFVDRKGVCDGLAACRDGSDEANCGGAGGSGGGGGGATSGSGGGGVATGGGGVATGGGGAVAASGGAPAADAGSTVQASPECQAEVDNEIAGCPMLDRDSYLADCARSTDQYIAEGCGQEWNAYLVCMAKATLACDTTTTGCERIQSGYLMCQSQFTVKIGCAVQGKDPICPAAKPYGLSCRTIPASCDQIVVSGGGSQLCCAAFPPM